MPLAWKPQINRLWTQIEEEEEKVEELEQPWLAEFQPGFLGISGAISAVQKGQELLEDYWSKPAAIEALLPAYKPPGYEVARAEYEREADYEKVAEILGITPEEARQVTVTGTAMPWYVPRQELFPGGELREVYEEWEAPWGVRGATELAAELPLWVAGWSAFGTTGLGRALNRVEAKGLQWLLKKRPFVRVSKIIGEAQFKREQAQMLKKFHTTEQYKRLLKIEPSRTRDILEGRFFDAYRYQVTGDTHTAHDILAQIWQVRPELAPQSWRRMTALIPYGMGGRAYKPISPEIWNKMLIPDKVKMVKSLNMSGTIASKAWNALSELQQATLLGQGRLPPEPKVEVAPSITPEVTVPIVPEVERVAWREQFKEIGVDFDAIVRAEVEAGQLPTAVDNLKRMFGFIEDYARIADPRVTVSDAEVAEIADKLRGMVESHIPALEVEGTVASERVLPDLREILRGLRSADRTVQVTTIDHLVAVAHQVEPTVLPRLFHTMAVKGETIARIFDYLAEIKKLPAIPKPITPRVAPPPVVEPMIADGQVTTIRNIARDKLMLDPITNVPTRNFNRLAKIMTGKKDINKMTLEEADAFIQALDSLVTRKGLPPRLPTRKTIITDEFAEKIPHLKEIGALERIRPTRQVFQKVGLRKEIWEPAFEAELLQDEAFRAFDAAISPFEKAIRSYEAREAIFSVLEGELDIATLNPIEKKAHNWLKARWDKHADKLKLPLEQRRKYYVTHTFEKGVADYLAETNKLDPDLIAALDYITPKTIFNPYLQKRLGQEVGLIRDPFKAARAYERKALKVEYYGPLVTKIRAYLPYLPPASRRELKGYITRITGRPLAIDRELNTTLAEFGKKIANLPGGKKLGEFLQTRNPSGVIAQQYVNLLYTMWLGFKPTSAIRNATQPMLSLCEVGPTAFGDALKLFKSAEGREAMKHNKVVRSRVQAPLPGVDSAFSDRWIGKVRKAAMYMFRGVDREWNVPIAYLSGYAEARRFGLPKEWAYKRGNEVAADTQFIYTKLGAASWSQSNIGRLLSPLTTWAENWMELITRWLRGRPSYVLREYEEATGKTIPQLESWTMKRKSALLYLAIVVSAYAAAQNTGVRWPEYTGFTSVRYIANIIGGRLPALDLPHAVGQLTIGALTNDNRMMMAGWNRLKPHKAFGIARQLEGILSGDKDWLTLFLYMTAGKKDGGLPERELPERRLPERVLPER